MPPSVQFTPQLVLDTAFELFREKGLSAVTARGIGKLLHSSSQPVYSAFSSMDELTAQVMQKAREFALVYLLDSTREQEPFLSIGMNYFRLARDEQNIFELVFLSPSDEQGKTSLFSAGLIDAMKADMALGNFDEAGLRTLLGDMWIYTHGLVSLVHAGALSLTEKEVEHFLVRMGDFLATMERDGRP